MSSPWHKHVKKTQDKHGCSYKEAMQIASKTYQKGGDVGESARVYTLPSKRAIRKVGSRYVISLRGTSDGKDVVTDLALAGGLLEQTPRYKADRRYVKRMIKQHGKDNIVLTGHSLGGAIARQLSRELGLSAEIYNPGASYRELVQDISDKAACLANPRGRKCKASKKVVSKRTVLDPVSALAGLSSKPVRQRKLNPHSLDNFQ